MGTLKWISGSCEPTCSQTGLQEVFCCNSDECNLRGNSQIIWVSNSIYNKLFTFITYANYNHYSLLEYSNRKYELSVKGIKWAEHLVWSTAQGFRPLLKQDIQF
jgi:hypothetical protein